MKRFVLALAIACGLSSCVPFSEINRRVWTDGLHAPANCKVPEAQYQVLPISDYAGCLSIDDEGMCVRGEYYPFRHAVLIVLDPGQHLWETEHVHELNHALLACETGDADRYHLGPTWATRVPAAKRFEFAHGY